MNRPVDIKTKFPNSFSLIESEKPLSSSTTIIKPQPIFGYDVFKAMLTIAIPVTLQTILFSSKGMVDLMMIGQLTEAHIAAIGVSSRALFVAIIFLSGITAGGAILASQHVGAKDDSGLHRSTALNWSLTTGATLIPLIIFQLYGDSIMRLSTDSDEVIRLGQQYLMISGLSLISFAFVSSFAASLRAMHQAAICTWISGFGILANVLLNWVLIFGHLGFPEYGLKGAAIATVLSSMLEVVILCAFLSLKKHPLRFGLSVLKRVIRWQYIRQFLSLSLPTTFNFLAWAGGLFTYTALMGQTGSVGLVALSVITPIETLSLSFLTGIANASSVLVGKQLGANKSNVAYAQAKGFTVIAIGVTLLISLLLWLLKPLVLDQFTALSSDTRSVVEQFYLILCLGIFLRSLPTLMVVGVLRAGGDVKFCLYQDLFTQWLFGIPLVALGVFLFKLSAPVIFAMFFLETLFKWVACLYRFRSQKWMNNLIVREREK